MPRPRNGHAIGGLHVVHRQLNYRGWSGFRPLRLAGSRLPYCHFLNAKDWGAVVGDWDGRVTVQ
jgi:hypothetical protein